MSVEACYVAVDWPKFQSLEPDSDLFQKLVGFDDDDEGDEADDDNEAVGADADGLDPELATPRGRARARMISFGGKRDMVYYFESWRMAMTFSDWFRPLRAQLDRKVIDSFASLFQAVGLLFVDKTFAPDAIRQGTKFADTWLIAAISPQSVKALCAQAQAIDRRALEREFDKALSLSPLGDFPNGQFFVHWVDELQAGLAVLARRGEGLVIGAA